MKKLLKNKKGFTLIELIIVIAIIIILAAIAIPTFSSILSDANEAAVTSEARNLYTLACIDLVQDEVDGETPAIDDDDEADLISAAGLDGDAYTASVSYENDKMTVSVEKGNISITIVDGVITDTDE